jgi:hypothetical protein
MKKVKEAILKASGGEITSSWKVVMLERERERERECERERER